MVDGYFSALPEWAHRRPECSAMLAAIGDAGCAGRRQAAIDAARRHGWSVAGPDLFASEPAWSVRDGVFRAGIHQVAELRDREIRAIDDLRRSGEPQRIVGELRKLEFRANALASMARSGLLDSVAGQWSRPQLLWLLLRSNDDRQGELFAPTVPCCLAAYPRERALADEWRTLGVLVSAHPVELVRRAAQARSASWRLPLTGCDLLYRGAPERAAIAARILAFDRSRPGGECFFEDDRGIFSVALCTVAAERLAGALDEGRELFLLAGRPKRGGCRLPTIAHLELERLCALDDPAGPTRRL